MNHLYNTDMQNNRLLPSNKTENNTMQEENKYKNISMIYAKASACTNNCKVNIEPIHLRNLLWLVCHLKLNNIKYKFNKK